MSTQIKQGLRDRHAGRVDGRQREDQEAMRQPLGLGVAWIVCRVHHVLEEVLWFFVVVLFLCLLIECQSPLHRPVRFFLGSPLLDQGNNDPLSFRQGPSDAPREGHEEGREGFQAVWEDPQKDDGLEGVLGVG